MRIAVGLVFALVLAAAAQGTSVSGSDIYEMGIYQVRIDGSGHTRLFDNPNVRNIGALSPDRGRVLVQYDNQKPELYSAAIDGTHVRLVARLPRGRYVDDAVWSPDGKRIAIAAVDRPCRHGCEVGEIWLTKPSGLGLRRLVRNGIAPTWSPDARRIAYVGAFHASLQEGASEGAVSVVNTYGPPQERRLRPLEHGRWNDWSVAWSPKRDQVTYSTWLDRLGARGQPTLRVVRASGRGGKRTLGAGKFAAWSPAGNRLLYWDAKSGRLVSSRPDGRQQRRLSRGIDRDPVSWSPDGRWIAFVGQADNCDQLFVVRPNGRGRRQLTDEGCPAFFKPFWSLDSKRLIYLRADLL